VSRARPRLTVARVVGGATALAVPGFAATAAFAPADEGFSVGRFAVALALFVLAATPLVATRRGGNKRLYGWRETAFLVCLPFVPTTSLLLAMTVSALLAGVARRQSALKLVFNTALVVVDGAVAIAIVTPTHLLRPTVNWALLLRFPDLLLVVAATAAMALVSALGTAIVVATVGPRRCVG